MQTSTSRINCFPSLRRNASSSKAWPECSPHTQTFIFWQKLQTFASFRLVASALSWRVGRCLPPLRPQLSYFLLTLVSPRSAATALLVEAWKYLKQTERWFCGWLIPPVQPVFAAAWTLQGIQFYIFIAPQTKTGFAPFWEEPFWVCCVQHSSLNTPAVIH